jgi:adenosylcobinamide-GDP ribazoletransferase
MAAALASLAGEVAGFDWWAGLLAVGLATIAAALVVRRAVRRFGGITGDVIGAAVEAAATAAVLGFCLAI